MDVEEIKQAAREGRRVHWKSELYVVRYYPADHTWSEQFLVVCEANGSAIGLTWADGVTLNGKPEDFYIGE